MSATENMKAALERFRVEHIPKDDITGSYEVNGPERDCEGHHAEHPSHSTEPSTNARLNG